MQVINGTATKVKNATQLHASSGDSAIQSVHITMFLLNNQQVQLKMPEPAMIDENDIVSVAGEARNGVFKGYAYKNVTTGVMGNSNYIAPIGFGIIMPIVALFILSMFTTSGIPTTPSIGVSSTKMFAIPIIVSLVFVAAGLFFIHMGARTLRAKKLLLNSIN